MKTVDWYQDEWFAKYHASHVTAEFSEWWLEFYDPPEDYESDDDRHEYFTRAAFALAGWRAANGDKQIPTY